MIGSYLVLLGLLCSQSVIAAQSAATANAKQSASSSAQQNNSTTNVQYHELTNDELLDQTETTFSAALDLFRKQSRGLSRTRFLLEQATAEHRKFLLDSAHEQQKSDEANDLLEESTGPHAPIESNQATQLALDNAQQTLDTYLQQQALTNNEKNHLQSHLQQLEETVVAVNSFEDVLANLSLPLFEIKLRLDDGTLLAEALPEPLQQNNIDTISDLLAANGKALDEELKKRKEAVNNTEQRLAENLTKTAAARAHYDGIHKQYTEHLEKEELVQKFMNKTPKQLINELDELVREMAGLKGALQISARVFAIANNAVIALENKLASLVAPDPAENGGAVSDTNTQTQSLSPVVEGLKATTQHLQQKLELSQQLHQQLMRLEELSAVYQSDAVVLNKHVFRAQMIVEVQKRLNEQGQTDGADAPAAALMEQLSQTKAEASEAYQISLTTANQGQLKADNTLLSITEARTKMGDIKAQLRQLELVIDSTKQIQNWTEKLNKMDAQALVASFEKTKSSLATERQKLDQLSEELEVTQVKAKTDQLEFDSLTDPLLREAQQQESAKKNEITNILYTFAGKEIPSQFGDSIEQPKTTASKKTSQPPVDLDKYQHMLTTRAHIIQAREEKREAFVNTLTRLLRQSERETGILKRILVLKRQQYATAVELKTRVGNRELTQSGIPEGIIDALKQDDIEQLKAHLTSKESKGAHLKQRIAVLAKPHTTRIQLQVALDKAIKAMGLRLDFHKDLVALQKKSSRSKENWTQVETTTIQQTALRRIEMDSGPEEFLLGLLPSSRAEKITEALQIYYEELIELELKKDSLAEQATINLRIIDLIEEEKAAIEGLLPWLQAELEEFEAREKEEWVILHAQLDPNQAQALLDDYHAQTGNRLPLPPPAKGDDFEDIIADGANFLFEIHTEIAAATKWSELFEYQLSGSGLNAQIGEYRDTLGSNIAESEALQRRIYRYIGHPKSLLNQMDEKDRPGANEMHRFLSGDIGMLRTNRADVRKQSIQQLLIRLVSILALAMITLIYSDEDHQPNNQAF